VGLLVWVRASKRTPRWPDLLHPAAGDELAEVDGEEACVLKKVDHLGLGICVVAGEEDHTLAACLVRVSGENRGAECVSNLHDACAGQQLGDHLARRPHVEVAAVEVIRSVQDDLAAPGEALHGVAQARPWHGENHDPRPRGVLQSSRRRPVRK
jgi:hypothetical protein